MCMPVSLYIHHMNAGAYGGQRWVSDPLELKLYMALRHLMWVLGTKPEVLGKSSK